MPTSDIFNSGFSDKSFLNLVKTMSEGLYNDAISAPSNMHKVNTDGLSFNYVNNNSVNACVWLENNIDFIHINTGTIVEMFAYFSSVFSDPTMFPNIGDITNERGYIVSGHFDQTTCQILYTGEPQNNERRLLSNYTSMMACRYIFCHELGHLLNGHCHLLKSLYSNGKIDMIAKSILAKISDTQMKKYALDRRTMEMDADSFASTRGMDNAIVMYENSKNYSFYFDLLENPLQIFTLWSFTIHSIFLLFEKDYPTRYNSYDFYLPNEAREMLNISCALCTLEEYINHSIFKCYSDFKKKIIDNLFIGISEAEKYFNKRFSTNFNYLLQTQANNKFIVFSNEVLNHWDSKLYSQLTPYSRTILYTPNTDIYRAFF